MSDPVRLLSPGSDASSLQRSLLSAGRARREPEGMRSRVLAGIAATTAAGAAASTAKAASAAGNAGATTKVAGAVSAITKAKVLVATAALAVAGGTTYATVRPSAPAVAVTTAATAGAATGEAAAPAVPTSATADPPTEEAILRPDDLPAAVPAAPATPAKRAPTRVTSTPPAVVATSAPVTEPPNDVSALRDEAALVEQARAALAAGDPATARDRLARADARFGHGALAEEREALAVRVAFARGERARAAALATAFVARHPASPMRRSIESIAQEK